MFIHLDKTPEHEVGMLIFGKFESRESNQPFHSYLQKDGVQVTGNWCSAQSNVSDYCWTLHTA